MSRTVLTEKDVEYGVLGGCILGGGGGGTMDQGLANGHAALRNAGIQLISIDEVMDEDIIITTSIVGAPSAKGFKVLPEDYATTVQNYQRYTNKKINGVVTNENGGVATTNGWIQASLLGIPIIDAPCNGRAHPTGTMGSLSLQKYSDYVSYQSFAGGNKLTKDYVEGILVGNMKEVTHLIRQASVSAKGAVAVARNPVTAEYLKKHGAIGGISHAIEIGKAWYAGIKKSPKDAIQDVCNILNAKIIIQGNIENYIIRMDGGYDIGEFYVGKSKFTFFNEYMSSDDENNQRIYTFPDLITTFDSNTGKPITTAEIVEGQNVVVIGSDKGNLKLGSSMHDKELFEEVEEMTKIQLVSYLF